MNEKYFDCIKKYGLSVNDIVIKEDIDSAVQEIANTRRPLVLIHGKPLNHEQVVTLISNEEPLFHNWDSNDLDDEYFSWIVEMKEAFLRIYSIVMVIIGYRHGFTLMGQLAVIY